MEYEFFREASKHRDIEQTSQNRLKI